MERFIKYARLDVHGKTIAVAAAECGSSEVRFPSEITITPEAIAKLARQLKTRGTLQSTFYSPT
jgi:hypothetical protein